MQEEEVKEETLEVKRERFLSKWETTIEQDQKLMTEQQPQRPLSRAYLSLCPFGRTQNKQVMDEKRSGTDYILEDPSTKKVNYKEDHVKQKIRKNLLDAGYPQAMVSQVMDKVQSLPESLVEAYYLMVKDDFKKRLS